jgi:hypothetical protein
VLYGRAGFLQAILFVRKYTADSTFGREMAVDLMEHIFAAGEAHSARTKSDLPFLWEWYGKEYLGAAHGVVGILFTLVSFMEEIKIIADRIEKDFLNMIKTTVDRLNVGNSSPSGTLHYSVGKVEDKLVHRCHGAPGHVLLLCRSATVFKNPDYLKLAELISNHVIFPRGLLKKGLGLCHGIGGNAYPFLAIAKLYLPGKHEQWVAKAQHFANFGLDKMSDLVNVPDAPYSLYAGLSGFAVLLLDLQDPNQAVFPCYNF